MRCKIWIHNTWTLYRTNLIAWACGCLRFATARFLCCKHLIREFRKKQQRDPTLRIIKKYPKQNNVIWNTTAPYLEIVADKNTTTRTQQHRTYIGPCMLQWCKQTLLKHGKANVNQMFMFFVTHMNKNKKSCSF